MTEDTASFNRHVKLFEEFDRYIARHREVYNQIPNNAHIVVTLHNDKAFNDISRRLIKNPRRKKAIEAHKTGRSWSVRPLKLPTKH